MTVAELPSIWNMIIWGFAATVAMTIVMQGAQGLGLSRLSLPFLLGTFFTGDRRRAVTVGFVSYVIGGWLFAFLYFLAWASTLGGWGSVPVCCMDCSCLWPLCQCCLTFIREWRPNTMEHQQ
jgi:hypothetical protein